TCPIASISKRYHESCKHELDMYRSLFGRGVKRTKCLSQGASACVYEIPLEENVIE
ncbi:MAG: ArsR family transcriptional regulator, partial [Nitrospirae bacterium]